MIGKNIQRIRKKKGLTLSECAERAKISKSYLSNIERNLNHNPSIHIIEKIATALGVELRTLIGSGLEAQLFLENEWLEFVNDLKKSGIRKDQLQEYKKVIEFAKWQKRQSEKE
ncbi:helix-turn-helix domain-containing protein [Lentibacillus sp. Marseille-P4043]|uniref:helix-turn-helix domain-containing protein n=1 Tax=Lentibacillus sp. Marseille-P4043 TaxID=2040293 RepID=UPI000D0B0B0D|nr:helix-turn-helix transcriptional regulator [Lentibacillus sp. Marseille-P4043]